jgi:hypothetical protein
MEDVCRFHWQRRQVIDLGHRFSHLMFVTTPIVWYRHLCPGHRHNVGQLS